MNLRRKVEGEKDGGKENGRKERRERKKAGRQEDRVEGFKKELSVTLDQWIYPNLYSTF